MEDVWNKVGFVGHQWGHEVCIFEEVNSGEMVCFLGMVGMAFEMQ